MRVLIAQVDPGAAEILMASLSADDRIDVVGTAGSEEEAVELVGLLEPDVVLIDLVKTMGPEAIRAIRRLGSLARILALTPSDSPDDVRLAHEAGADAFVRNDLGPDELARAFFETASLAVELGRRPD
jgi:DNA-binding NarL/FixJ family response regulator